jgi:hypothetical protein
MVFETVWAVWVRFQPKASRKLAAGFYLPLEMATTASEHASERIPVARDVIADHAGHLLNVLVAKGLSPFSTGC